MLVGDGTHVGVSLRKMKVRPMEKPDEARDVQPHFKMYDCFLLFKRKGISNKHLCDN